MATGILNPRVDVLVNMAHPVNRLHPQNRDLVTWGMALPGTMGGARFMDVMNPGPNGKHLTLTDMNPATAWVGSKRPGGWGALEFDAVNDRAIHMAPIGGPIGASNRTTSFWFKTTSIVGQTMLSWGDTTTANLWAVRKEESGGVRLFRLAVIDGNRIWQFPGYDDGEWHEFTVVLNGTNTSDLVAYGDGEVLTIDSTSALVLDTTDEDFTIGSLGDASEFFEGQLDAIRMVSRALSATEVRELHSLGKRGFPGMLNRIASGPVIASAEPAPVNGAGLPPYGQVIFNSADEANRPRYGQRIARATEE